jgi:hypothetical protein
MNFKDLLSFKTMLTPKIMRIYFIVIACVIALFTLIGFIGTLIQGGLMVLMSLVVLIGGALYLVFFRVFCEILILFFSMHEELVEMRKVVAPNSTPSEPAEPAAPAYTYQPQTPQTQETPPPTSES